MKELLKELNEAYVILGSIALSGNAVDTMALAKAKLRKVAGGLRERAELESAPTEGTTMAKDAVAENAPGEEDA